MDVRERERARKGTRIGLPSAIALIVLTAGCGSPGSGPSGVRVPKVPAPTAEVLGLRLPTDTYLLSVDEIYDGEEAADLLTRQCMKKHGYDWRLIERPDFGDWRNRRRYGVVEPEVAKNFGYHPVPALLSPTEVYEKKQRRERGLTPEEKRTATDEKTGCQRRSNDALWRGIDYDQTLATRFNSKALADSAKDPKVVRAVREWSSCMRRAGHEYPTLDKAIGDPRWDMRNPPSDEEKTVAVADVKCQTEVGLIRTWFAVDSALQKKWIEQKPSDFKRILDAKNRFLAKAKAVRAGEK
ncbi:hypothetical protein ACH4SP_19515 [Streptomyces sp. NPDC021093]|uniref:hypothetical protein n=1 Tax=Streptomyces sp. NPDC021093 TaxID=3365112 RepID=UPI0037B64A62